MQLSVIAADYVWNFSVCISVNVVTHKNFFAFNRDTFLIKQFYSALLASKKR